MREKERVERKRGYIGSWANLLHRKKLSTYAHIKIFYYYYHFQSIIKLIGKSRKNIIYNIYSIKSFEIPLFLHY